MVTGEGKDAKLNYLKLTSLSNAVSFLNTFLNNSYSFGNPETHNFKEMNGIKGRK